MTTRSTYLGVHRVVAIRVDRVAYPDDGFTVANIILTDEQGNEITVKAFSHGADHLTIDDPDAPITAPDPDDADAGPIPASVKALESEWMRYGVDDPETTDFATPLLLDYGDTEHHHPDDRDPSVCPRRDGTGNGLGTYSPNPEFNTLDACEECEGTGTNDARNDHHAREFDGDALYDSLANINKWGDSLAKQRANRSGLFPNRHNDPDKAALADDMTTWAEFGGEGR